MTHWNINLSKEQVYLSSQQQLKKNVISTRKSQTYSNKIYKKTQTLKVNDTAAAAVKS